MADGRIVIAVDVDGNNVAVLRSSIKGLDDDTKKSNNSIKDMAISLGLVKVASAAIDVLKNSLDGAISRFDTMERYPKVMSALGYSADESTASINQLSDGIDGLPTRLDEVVSTAQQMTAITGNLDDSTAATIALNNAFLASGASSADASRGMQQYVQMLAKGEVDMQSWKTLQETMPIGLQKTAEAMGFVGETAQRSLYAALKEGEITFKDFQNQLIELGTGTGELAELAKINSEGIATSFSNLKNSSVKGLANVMKAIDDLLKATTGKSIAQNLDSLKVVVNNFFNVLIASIKATEPVIKIFISLLKNIISIAKPLTPVLIGLAAAFATFKILNSINNLIAKHQQLLVTAKAVSQSLTLATNASTIAKFGEKAATEGVAAAELAKNGIVKISTLLVGVLTGTTSLYAAGTAIATAATTAFSAALKIALGPIGWIVAAIGVLVTAVVSLVKWFNKETEASKELKASQEELVSSTDELTESVDTNSKSRKDSISQVENSKAAYKDLTKQLDELMNKEKKTAADKKQIASIVEELNNSIDGLNLAYSEESDNLSMSTDLINKRINALSEQEKANVAQQQLTEILKEQHEVEGKLEENSKAREVWNQKLEDGSVKSKEAKEALEGLDEQQKTLTSTLSSLKTEQTETSATIESSTIAVTEATKNGVFEQVVAYDTLTEGQQKMVDDMRSGYDDLKTNTTDVFSAIEQETAISLEQMKANLETNRQATEEWSNNLKILAERGVDEGLLQTLRDGGPEMAAQTAALVASSDEELASLNDVYRNNADAALEQYAAAHNIDLTEVPASIKAMVTAEEQTFAEAIQAADFASLGSEVGAGAAAGIAQSSSKAEQESKIMAEQTSKAFTTALEIHSPSRVFQKHGGYLGEGLAKGINESSKNVIEAMNRLGQVIDREMKQIVQASKRTSNQISQAFSSLPSEMENIGRFAMQGLANGINGASGAAISAAKNVASQIKSTMTDALDIHSPSRWARDMVGKNISKGVAIGIESDSDIAFKAIDAMTSRLMTPIAPEIAIGATAGMFSNLGAVSTTNITNNNITKNDRTDELIEIGNKMLEKDNSTYLDGEKVSKGLGALNDAVQGRRYGYTEWGLEM